MVHLESLDLILQNVLAFVKLQQFWEWGRVTAQHPLEMIDGLLVGEGGDWDCCHIEEIN